MIKSDKYLSSLLPNFEKGRIDSAIASTRKEFTEVIIPVYERTDKAFSASKLALPKEIEEEARANLPRYKDNAVSALLKVLSKANEKLTLCESLVKEHFETYVTKEGMTFAKANAIRFTELLEFTGMYARRLLLLMYADAASSAVTMERDTRMYSRELSWLVGNSVGFFRALQILDTPVNELERKFKAIPHLNMIEGHVEEAETTIGKHKTDPALLGLLPHQLNPIFHVRVIWEDFQEGRRKAAIEEARQMELYIILLKDGKITPKIKREIEHSEARLAKANRTIKNMLEDAIDDD